MQACLGHRETWSLAFQLRMFVPNDVQVHLPASLCTSTLWTLQQGRLSHGSRTSTPTAHIVVKWIRKLLVNLATARGVYRESA
jgi:hypothetical protein